MLLPTTGILLVQIHFFVNAMMTHHGLFPSFGIRKWTVKLHSSISTETDVEAVETSIPSTLPSVVMQLSIPRDRLVLVNDLAGISTMLNIFTTAPGLYPIIGVDCEWEPENYYNRTVKKQEDNNDIELDDDDQDAIQPDSTANTTTNALDTVDIARYQRLIDQLTEIDDPSKITTNSNNISKQSTTQNKKKADKKPSKPSTPVQLVQIATHDYIFLIDMPALCRQTGPGLGHTLLEKASSSSLPSGRDSDSNDAHPQSESLALTATESMLNQLFRHLFSNPQFIKVGMGPQTDFKRLYW